MARIYTTIRERLRNFIFGQRYETKVPMPNISAEQFRKIVIQFRKDKAEYLTRKTEELRKQNSSCSLNSSCYTDERVINALEKSYELQKSYYSKKE